VVGNLVYKPVDCGGLKKRERERERGGGGGGGGGAKGRCLLALKKF
jgi:hypothetical protein